MTKPKSVTKEDMLVARPIQNQSVLSGILEIRCVWGDAEANALLETKKWKIVRTVIKGKDRHGSICHIMARISK